jgi:arginyl-tRNA synthetase
MKDILESTIKRLFGVDCNVDLSRSVDANFGDCSTNIAFQLSKIVKSSPRDIARQIVEELNSSRLDDSIDKISFDGPGFINITYKSRYLINRLNAEWSEQYGENNDGEKKTVIVEYPSPNIAKPYSVGHLRPGNQGWAAKRLMEVTGWTVVTDNHIGDYGAPFGMWVVGFLKFSNDEKLKDGGVYELGRVYIEIKKELSTEKTRGEHDLADKVQDWLLRLERGDEEARNYRDKFKKISLDHIHSVMKRLEIATDYELGEAFFAPMGKKCVQNLLEQGVAIKNDDNSIIVNLDKYNIDTPLLIQKSNGAALYATTDLATLIYREKTWNPSRVIYCVAAEQQFYFKQLFALSKILGIKTELIHMWFGLIDQISSDGVREKMSSRKGVVLMEELLDKAEVMARNLVKNPDVDDDDVKAVALGAIKFSDFTADRRKNILFDWNTIFALSGFSGPYIQYAAVRINKIINSEKINDIDTSEYDYSTEKALIRKLLEYPSVVKKSADNLEPHHIANYLFDLAKESNKYYENVRIATSNDIEKSARLSVLRKTSYVLKHGLSILGIRVPKSM